MISWILFVIFSLIQVFDVYSTLKILGNEGKELNPIMRFLIEKFGRIKALVGSKVIILTILGFVVGNFGGSIITMIGLALLIILYTFILYKYNVATMLGK